MPEVITAPDQMSLIEVEPLESAVVIQLPTAQEDLIDTEVPQAQLVLTEQAETLEVYEQPSEVLEVVVGGERGPEGVQGPPGPVGGQFVFNKLTPDSEWEIRHDLDMHPNVTVIDSSGAVSFAHIEYLSPNRITLTFSSSVAGVAYLS